MKLNSLTDYAHFFQVEVKNLSTEILYKMYDLYGNVWNDGSVICRLKSCDEDFFIFSTNRYCSIYIKSLGIDNIDISDPHWLSPEREEEVLDYLNNRFASIGEKVLQEI